MSSLKKGFGKYLKDIDLKLDGNTKRTCEQVITRVKELTPVRTGLLKSSWKLVKHKKMKYSIQNDAKNSKGNHYGQYVESGSTNMEGQHMLKKAVAQTKGLRMGAGTE